MAKFQLARWGEWVHPSAAEVLAQADVAEVPVPEGGSPVDLDMACEALYIRAPHIASAEVIASLSDLRLIAVPGAGLEIVDLDAATARGIPVLHGRGFGSRAVAEWVIGAMVWLARDVSAMDRAVRDGHWAVRHRAEGRRDLASLKLGVIGFGQIGRLVAQKASTAFGSAVLVTETVPRVADGARELGFQVVELETLLKNADIVSVNAAASHRFQSLLDGHRIRLIGGDGYLINTARGQLVDLETLAAALEDGGLGGAAIDVYPEEPPPAAVLESLKRHPRVLLSPHAAGMTSDAVRALAVGVASSIVHALSGGRPANCANPEVWR